MTDAVRLLEAAHDCFDAVKSCVRGTSVDFDSKVFGADAIDSNYYRLELKPPSSAAVRLTGDQIIENWYC